MIRALYFYQKNTGTLPYYPLGYLHLLAIVPLCSSFSSGLQHSSDCAPKLFRSTSMPNLIQELLFTKNNHLQQSCYLFRFSCQTFSNSNLILLQDFCLILFEMSLWHPKANFPKVLINKSIVS